MIHYLPGMIIGGIVILVGIVYTIFLNRKKNNLKKLIKDIGQTAEDKINQNVKVWSKHTKNKFIPATIFGYGKDKVFEVDSILITSKALIVIEIKSIRGGIEGDAKESKWFKVLGENRFPIKNPIAQNDKHIEHLVKMTSIKLPILSLIVFSNRTEYINVKNTPGHAIITREVDLFNTLDKINESLKSRLNEQMKMNVFKTIKGHRTNNKKDVKLHREITTGKSRR